VKMTCVRIFADVSGTVDMLTDEGAGRLLKALLHYLNGQEDEVPGEERILFSVLKSQMDRDERSYAAFKERQRINGKKGGRPRKQRDQADENAQDGLSEKPMGFFENPKNLESESESEFVSEEEFESESEAEAEAEFVSESVSEKEFESESAAAAAGYHAPATASTPSFSKQTGTGTRTAEPLSREVFYAAVSCGLPMHPVHMQTARELIKEFGEPWVLAAIQRTSDASVQSWGYVKGILRSWRAQGGMDEPVRRKSAAARRQPPADGTQQEDNFEQFNNQTLALLKEASELDLPPTSPPAEKPDSA
jgi:DnaD/phage-associated family protein